MGEQAGGPGRLRGFVAGLRRNSSECWRPKEPRIPTHPIELANRSARHASQLQNLQNPQQDTTQPQPQPQPQQQQQQPSQRAEQLGGTSGRRNAIRGSSGRRSSVVESRQVHINDDEPSGAFVDNTIKTSKYNPLTFLPKFLFEMFSRVAYLYFLLQAGLSWWDVVSPFGGLGATAALSFVLLMSGGKAIIEDFKRHTEDEKTNTSQTTIVNPSNGEEHVVKWKDISVGDVVRVCDDELFPADLLCLDTGLADGVCFIRTTNLDGESNLKIRKSVDLRSISESYTLPETSTPQKWAFRHTAVLECETPNRNLHKFKGRFILAHNQMHQSDEDKHITVPLSMNEMLLRGTVLKNSQYVYGLVVYTGHDTRIQMNAAKVPLKMGSFDQFLNLQITLIIIVQIVLCALLALANLQWRDHFGVLRDQLAFNSYVEGNYENGLVYFSLVFLTFWILTAYMVPISLFVTMEIVKFWQAFVFINNDPNMATHEESARARNSNLNEDLGKIEYVFSDKTGTLTSNDMQLRFISVKNVTYGRADCRLEELGQDMYGMPALQTFDEDLAESIGRLKRAGFWSKLMATGGSRQFILSLPNSSPKLRKMRTMDRNNLKQELIETCTMEGTETCCQLQVFNSNDSHTKVKNDSVTHTANLSVCSQDVSEVVLGWHIVDFWMNACICHSLIIEEHTDENGKVQRVYQGPSPDEIALVEAARKLGFELLERTMTGVVLSMQGLEVRFEILNVLEFTSDRKRMSVIAQAPDGTIHLFVKGADSVMLPRLKRDGSHNSVLRESEEALHKYSVQGLRTLVLGSKIMDEETYLKWDAEYQDVAGSLSADRDNELNRMAEKLEIDLQLVGITAIEDKLQEGVPRAIQTLSMAGMKVWMITGDKMETAINIGISCQLISDQETLLVLTAEHFLSARDKLHDLTKAAQARLKAGLKVELCVDGPSLVHILGKSLEIQLAYLGSLCSGVVICRSSPSQKAAIVKIMKEFELRKLEDGPGGPLLKFFRRRNGAIKTKMLAIGDGANDVTMIQAADIGVGIAGKEGRQAVNNSDYSISQFRFLVRLLLVHGQLSHYRLARLIKFSFFKNITFAFILMFYQLHCGFSGQALVDDISAAMFNVVFTSLPILLFSVLDRVLDDRLLMRFPQMYNSNTSLSTAVFWRTGVLQGIVNAAICFYIPYYGASPDGIKSSDSLWAVGKTIYVSMLFVVTVEVALVARYWTLLFAVFTVLSFVCVFPYLLLFPYAEWLVGYFDERQFGIAENLLTSPTFWLSLVLVSVASFAYRYYIRISKWLFNPDDNMILAEFESQKGALAELTLEERERLSALDVIPLPDEANRSHSNSHVNISQRKQVEFEL